MEILFELQRSLLEQYQQQTYYHRKIFDQLTFDNDITGVVGPRGVGKTTFLLKQTLLAGAERGEALYISADNIYFINNALFELAGQLYKETDVKLLCIDEVHKYPNWQQELKNIADTYGSIKVLFTGSSMIDIIHGKYDLSRRVTLHHLHGLSFREYLEFSQGIELPTITLEALLNDPNQFNHKLNLQKPLKAFKDYLRVGYFPFYNRFSLEHEIFQAIENAAQKTIYEDIATLHNLKTPTLMLIEQLLKFVINSSAGEISAYKLSSSLGKPFETITTCLKYLENAGLIRFLYPKKAGHAYLRSPAKMLPDNTCLMYANYLPQFNDAMIGKTRETFLLNQLQSADYQTFYSEKGDIRVDRTTFEIGGKSKTASQIHNESSAFLVKDGILTASRREIPLFLFGFLY